ncbi:MAG: PE-PPE domain-containing protein [Gordonia sp. (in: high G+C Gram-positive bacteria)]|uniref:cutinase family protein n=1 Tax=Gordonia sp. (in: high G+C Gram-positive bacteria) TaxID=84139 RepID=UPI0039E4E04A
MAKKLSSRSKKAVPLVVVALALVPPGAAFAGGDTSAGCGEGAAVIVAGTGAPRNHEGLPTGGVEGAGKRYANEGYKVEYVDYPTDLFPVGPIPYDQDVAIGKAATEKAVSRYQAQCPGKPVTVVGYSQGARIAGDVISDAGNGRSKVKAEGLRGELYSDPRRQGLDGVGGIENTLAGLTPLPGATMSGPRAGGFGSVPVTGYCLQGDPICDLPNPLLRPFAAVDGLVGYFTKHGYYPARMNEPVGDGRTWHCDPAYAGYYADCEVPADPAVAQAIEQRAAQQPETGTPTAVVNNLIGVVDSLYNFNLFGVAGNTLGAGDNLGQTLGLWDAHPAPLETAPAVPDATAPDATAPAAPAVVDPAAPAAPVAPATVAPQAVTPPAESAPVNLGWSGDTLPLTVTGNVAPPAGEAQPMFQLNVNLQTGISGASGITPDTTPAQAMSTLSWNPMNGSVGVGIGGAAYDFVTGYTQVN